MHSDTKDSFPRALEVHRPQVFMVNAFSLNMLSDEVTSINIRRDVAVAGDCFWVGTGKDRLGYSMQYASECFPVIGHEDTARVIQKTYRLQHSLFNRETITMRPEDLALVLQYVGPRLPEGATQLPDGAKIVPIVVQCVGLQAYDEHVY